MAIYIFKAFVQKTTHAICHAHNSDKGTWLGKLFAIILCGEAIGSYKMPAKEQRQQTARNTAQPVPCIQGIFLLILIPGARRMQAMVKRNQGIFSDRRIIVLRGFHEMLCESDPRRDIIIFYGRRQSNPYQGVFKFICLRFVIYSFTQCL